MKPFPKSDFPVQVFEEYWERDSEDPAREHYRGIYHVQLNFTVRIVFIPAFDRLRPWEVVDRDEFVAGEPADVTTPQVARLEQALCSPYVVTPDPERAGSDEVIQQRTTVPFAGGQRVEVWPVVLFYVSGGDFERYAAELARLEHEIGERGTRYPVAPALAVSQLGDCGVTRLLLDRIIASGRLERYDLEMLGRW